MEINMITFELNYQSETESYDKYWEMCVGSCHAATALRADWQALLTKCHRELGFRYVRFHGLFDDDMSVVNKPLLSRVPEYCFTNIDKIYDFLLSIGMKPFVELGFMPSALASGTKTVFAYKGNTTLPKEENIWIEFIKAFVRHLLERYGRDEVRTWFFEVWNEPNLGGEDSPVGFFTGTKEQYFHLYTMTASAVKSVDAGLKLGGPSTSNNAWLPEFIQYCRDSGSPLDFITTHHYPTDVVLGYGVEDSANFNNPMDFNEPEKIKKLMDQVQKDPSCLEEIREQYSVFQSHLWERVERGVLTDMARKAREETAGYPLYYTEWGSLAGLESDGPFGASFIAKTAMDNMGLVEGYSFWTFCDIIEESGQAAPVFHGGFGLMTQQGIPKAPYRAFQLLHKLGSQRYLTVLGKDTIDMYAFRAPEINALQLLAVNHNSLLHPIKEEEVTLKLYHVPECVRAEKTCVDEEHANALGEWKRLGKPVYIGEKQKLMLEAASCLETEAADFIQEGEEISLSLLIPAMGTMLVTLYF